MTVPDDMGAIPSPGEPGSSEQMTANRINPERLLAQAGGVSGVIYSSLPVVVFVIASSVSGLVAAIAAALGVAALVLLWRLVRRDSPQPAISGFFGVALCALIAYVVGESKGYFLLGIWMSLLWAVVVAASVLIRRPLVGYAWSWAGGRRLAQRAAGRVRVRRRLAVLGAGVRRPLRGAGAAVRRDRTGWLTYAAIKSAQRAIAAVELASGAAGE